MKKPKVRTALDAIADTVLAYRILEKKRATGKEK